MPHWIIAIGAVLALATSMRVPAAETTAPVAIAIHGGAGTIERAALTAERREAIEADLTRALEAGHAILRDGGSSLDAVTAAVIVLEDSPHFNAGKGAVFNADGRIDLDEVLEAEPALVGHLVRVPRRQRERAVQPLAFPAPAQVAAEVVPVQVDRAATVQRAFLTDTLGRDTASGVMVGIMAGMFLAALDQSIVGVALPRITSDLAQLLAEAAAHVAHPAIRVGSIDLFETLLAESDMPDVWRPRIRHRFGHERNAVQVFDAAGRAYTRSGGSSRGGSEYRMTTQFRKPSDSAGEPEIDGGLFTASAVTEIENEASCAEAEPSVTLIAMFACEPTSAAPGSWWGTPQGSCR